MPLPITIILIVVVTGAVIFRIARWNPDMLWERRQRMYRNRGLIAQRPENWEQTAMRQKIGAICFVLLIVLWFAWMVIAGVVTRPDRRGRGVGLQPLMA